MAEETITQENVLEQDEIPTQDEIGLEPPDDAVLTRPQIDHYGEPISELVKLDIQDNGEPLVDIFAVSRRITWAVEGPRWNFPRTGLARETVARMLAQAQELLPNGLRL